MAPEGAPPPDKPFHRYVHVAWYRIDAETEIVIGLVNVFAALFFNISTALYILELNINNDYFYVAILQMVGTLFYVYTQIVIIFYAFFNLEVVLAKYDIKNWVQLEFTSTASIMFENYTPLGLLVYLDQLLLGNKRLAFYGNLVMGATLFLFPISSMWSWYYVVQLPLDFFMEFLLYPLFPEYDLPYIRWENYLGFDTWKFGDSAAGLSS